MQSSSPKRWEFENLNKRKKRCKYLLNIQKNDNTSVDIDLIDRVLMTEKTSRSNSRKKHMRLQQLDGTPIKSPNKTKSKKPTKIRTGSKDKFASQKKGISGKFTSSTNYLTESKPKEYSKNNDLSEVSFNRNKSKKQPKKKPQSPNKTDFCTTGKKVNYVTTDKFFDVLRGGKLANYPKIDERERPHVKTYSSTDQKSSQTERNRKLFDNFTSQTELSNLKESIGNFYDSENSNINTIENQANTEKKVKNENLFLKETNKNVFERMYYEEKAQNEGLLEEMGKKQIEYKKEIISANNLLEKYLNVIQYKEKNIHEQKNELEILRTKKPEISMDNNASSIDQEFILKLKENNQQLKQENDELKNQMKTEKKGNNFQKKNSALEEAIDHVEFLFKKCNASTKNNNTNKSLDKLFDESQSEQPDANTLDNRQKKQLNKLDTDDLLYDDHKIAYAKLIDLKDTDFQSLLDAAKSLDPKNIDQVDQFIFMRNLYRKKIDIYENQIQNLKSSTNKMNENNKEILQKDSQETIDKYAAEISLLKKQNNELEIFNQQQKERTLKNEKDKEMIQKNNQKIIDDYAAEIIENYVDEISLLKKQNYELKISNQQQKELNSKNDKDKEIKQKNDQEDIDKYAAEISLLKKQNNELESSNQQQKELLNNDTKEIIQNNNQETLDQYQNEISILKKQNNELEAFDQQQKELASRNDKEIKSLNDKNVKLNNQIQLMTRQNQKHQNKIDRLEDNAGNCKKEYKEAAMKILKLESVLEEKKNDITSYQDEITVLINQRDSIVNLKNISDEKCNHLNSELEKVKNENIECLAEKNATIESLKKMIEDLQDEITKLDARDEKREDQEEINEELLMKNISLNQQIATKDEMIQNLQSELENTKKVYFDQESQNKSQNELLSNQNSVKKLKLSGKNSKKGENSEKLVSEDGENKIFDDGKSGDNLDMLVDNSLDTPDFQNSDESLG